MTGLLGAWILLLVPEVERRQAGQDTGSRVELDIEAGEPTGGSSPPRGTGALHFYGWLELVAAIQTIRHRPVAPEA